MVGKMRGFGTTRMADWLDQPDPFDAVTAFLHDRGLASSARVMLAIVSASSMLAPLALVVPTYHEVTLVFAGIIALVGVVPFGKPIIGEAELPS